MELIINENALLPDFVPGRLPGREREIREIAHNFRLALEGRRPENVLIHGVPGTGKTATVKFVIRELEGVSNRVRVAYVNCWQAGTRAGILNEAARAAGVLLPPKGTPAETIMGRLAENAKKKGLAVIVVLDEMDRLIASGHGDVLYDLSRIGETYGARLSVVGIANDVGLIMGLDPRIRSSAIGRDIEFRAYDVPSLKAILEERARIAFSAHEPDAVGLCAAHAYKKNGDARTAISLLLSAGRVAERAGKRTLDAESVEKAAAAMGNYRKDMKAEAEPTDIERKIIGILEEGEIRSGELYARLKGVSDRTLRNYISRLEEFGVIETADAGGKGKSRILRLVKR